MLAVAIVALVYTLIGALAWMPSVHYFPNNYWGIHLLAPGRTLQAEDAYASITVRSTCKCKLACKADALCVAASSSKSVSGEVSCLLSSKGPTETKVTIAHETSYVYWFDSLPAINFGIREDGLLYLVKKTGLNFTDAKMWCNQIPGYRLAIFKNPIQYSMAMQLTRKAGRCMWVDLVPNDNQLIWGDGTRFEDTPFSQVAITTVDNSAHHPSAMRFTQSGLNDRYKRNNCPALCQANPRGIVW